METLTLQQSTIRGVVLGKAVFCTLRGSPAGLQLAAGNYLLRPALNNPVYGLVMALEPLSDRVPTDAIAISYAKIEHTAARSDLGASAVKFTDPAAHKATDPAAVKFTNPSAVKFTDPSAVKFTDPAAIKFTPPSQTAPAVKVDFAAAPAVKVDVAAAPAVKFDTAAAPAIKFDTAAAPAVKFDAAAAVATLGLPHSAPAIKFDTAAGQVNQPVMISERSIAGNSFQATAGFGDLVDVVQRAGAVKLVVI